MIPSAVTSGGIVVRHSKILTAREATLFYFRMCVERDIAVSGLSSFELALFGVSTYLSFWVLDVSVKIQS
jgi:hypothetical protein